MQVGKSTSVPETGLNISKTNVDVTFPFGLQSLSNTFYPVRSSPACKTMKKTLPPINMLVISNIFYKAVLYWIELLLGNTVFRD